MATARQITHGDRALVDYLTNNADEHWDPLNERQSEHIGDLQVTAMFACDVYPLADGREVGIDGYPGASVLPTFAAINTAMDVRLLSVLEPDEQWMVAIPRVAAPGKPNTELVVSSSGGAALLLPMAAYGTLFRWNEHLVAMQHSRLRGENPSMFLDGGPIYSRGLGFHHQDRTVAGLFGHLFTGSVLPRSISTEDRSKFLLAGREWRKTPEGMGARVSIWACTVFQQAMMVLHEFGHIASINEGSEIPGVTRGDRLYNELTADAKMRKWLISLADGLTGGGAVGRVLAAEAVWHYFMLLDIVDQVYKRSNNARELNVRVLYLLADLDVAGAYHDLGMRSESANLIEYMRDIAECVGGPDRIDFAVYERAGHQSAENHAHGSVLNPAGFTPIRNLLDERRGELNLFPF